MSSKEKGRSSENLGTSQAQLKGQKFRVVLWHFWKHFKHPYHPSTQYVSKKLLSRAEHSPLAKTSSATWKIMLMGRKRNEMHCGEKDMKCHLMSR